MNREMTTCKGKKLTASKICTSAMAITPLVKNKIHKILFHSSTFSAKS